ncbi:MAG: hypothetical protein J6X62_02760 [Bacteroidales bacterium]|nr:hypothetical protein [Bacteroidales bacterium]
MPRFYKYCYYRLVSMFHKHGFTDTYYGTTRLRNYASSMAVVTLIQWANLNTLLIIPALALKRQMPDYVGIIILAALAIYNMFVLNIYRLYAEGEERWKDEPPRSRKTRKWLVILFSVASLVMMIVAIRIVYAPHTLSIPH